uniref:Uncharacterized protein n=1 Tax=Hyaloperonospora arabidopsidis (strain Emoy2) TaxID=559515 RepID=M4BDP8_HYAAE
MSCGGHELRGTMVTTSEVVKPRRGKTRKPRSLLLLLKSFVGLRVRIDLKNDSVIEDLRLSPRVIVHPVPADLSELRNDVALDLCFTHMRCAAVDTVDLCWILDTSLLSSCMARKCVVVRPLVYSEPECAECFC